MAKYLMALDQGTTSSRCILFEKEWEDSQYGTEGILTDLSTAGVGGA